jgi:hypothetical protein
MNDNMKIQLLLLDLFHNKLDVFTPIGNANKYHHYYKKAIVYRNMTWSPSHPSNYSTFKSSAHYNITQAHKHAILDVAINHCV